jgi:hypothetical protein
MIQLGDVFATENPMALGKAINAVQTFTSKDNASRYSHTGVLTSPFGDALEVLWTVKSTNIFEKYAGKQIVVARPEGEQVQKEGAIKHLKNDYLGRVYPLWRLPLFIYPPLAKTLTFKGKFLVCSEFTAKYEYLIGARHGYYTGTNPDMLVDEWQKWRNFEIIFAGPVEDLKALLDFKYIV